MIRNAPAQPLSLPLPPSQWNILAIEKYAALCFAAIGLHDWRFGWDRAVRRLGCCHYRKRCITLSLHFVTYYAERNGELIRRTLLHELAHALAFVHAHENGHGATWRYFCSLLGIPGEKAACKCDDFAPHDFAQRPFRYALCHCETGEVFYRYRSRPRMSSRRLSQAYIRGRKQETLGKLTIIALS